MRTTGPAPIPPDSTPSREPSSPAPAVGTARSLPQVAGTSGAPQRPVVLDLSTVASMLKKPIATPQNSETIPPPAPVALRSATSASPFSQTRIAPPPSLNPEPHSAPSLERSSFRKPGLDETKMPTALPGRTVNQVFAFGTPEGPAALAALPHYQIGPKGALSVSHLELRVAVAQVQESMGQVEARKFADVDPVIQDLEARGYIRKVDMGEEFPAILSDTIHEDLEDVIRKNLPKAYEDLGRRLPRLVYEMTDAGITAGRLLRGWNGQGEIKHQDDARAVVAQGFEVGHAQASTVAGQGIMMNRLESGVLGSGELGSFHLAEMASLRETISRDPYDISLAAGRLDEILMGLEVATVHQLEIQMDPEQAPLRSQDLQTLLTHASGVLASLRQHPEAQYAMLDESTVYIEKVEGARKAMKAIEGARKSGLSLNDGSAWSTLASTPEAYSAITREQGAGVTAAAAVWTWSQEVEPDPTKAERIFDAFAQKAFGSQGDFIEGLKRHLRTPTDLATV